MTHPNTRQYLLERAPRIGASSFFGDPIGDMDRDELIGLIVWMQDEMDRMDAQRRRLDSL